MEQVLDGDAERLGEAECKLERGVPSARLDRVDGHARYLDDVRELRLGESGLEAMSSQ